MVDCADSKIERLKTKVFQIIFESDTFAGKLFDILLIVFILASAVVVMFDSISDVRTAHSALLNTLDWIFTAVFTLEYLTRIWCSKDKVKYLTGFFGLVDLFAIFPAYLSYFFPGLKYLSVIRLFRVLRIFRILKLAQYVGEAQFLTNSLFASRRKIAVFLFAVFNSVIVLGSAMYLVEGEQNGFTSIPTSIYWAIVTLTTVGYGDISPKTPLGQAISVVVMLLGYSIIAVPTGIVTVEMSNQKCRPNEIYCLKCGISAHDKDAVFCKYCGSKLADLPVNPEL